MLLEGFVDALYSENAIEALETFVTIVSSEEDGKNGVLEFLQTSPTCDAILQLFSSKHNTKHDLAVIFEALGYILIRLTEEKNNFDNVILHITRFVLQNHSTRLLYLLSTDSSNVSKEAALQFLTGVVLNGSGTAREVLTYLNMKQINFNHLANQRDRKKTKDVRTHLFHLILAFLNIDDPECVNQLLHSNYDFVTCIFERLPEDSSELVIKLLTLLHDAVVCNAQISKTIKLKVFNMHNCRSLTTLYFNESKLNKTNISTFYTFEEKVNVKKALHRLMIMLCTNQKFGVVFKTKKQDESNKDIQNSHVLNILKNITLVWTFDEGRELVWKVYQVCPDVPPLFRKTISPYSNPSEDLTYFALVKLFVKLMESHRPWTEDKNCLLEKWTDSNLMIPEVQHSPTRNMMDSENFVVRHSVVIILMSVLLKAKEAIEQINKYECTANVRKNFKAKVLQCIMKMLGSPGNITSVWAKCVSFTKYEVPAWFIKECPSQMSSLANIAHTLLLCVDLFGLEYFKKYIHPLRMLKDLLSIQQEEIDKNVTAHHKSVMFVLKILLLAQKKGNFFTSGYTLSEESSENIDEDNVNLSKTLFHLIITTYTYYRSKSLDNDSEEIGSLCVQLLNGCLQQWGLSTSCNNYISIWLCEINMDERDKCSEFLAIVITKAIKGYFSYLDTLLSLDCKNDTKAQNVLRLIEDTDECDAEDTDVLTGNEVTLPFSCLVLAASDILETIPEPTLLTYFANVVTEYIHYLKNPKIMAEYLLSEKRNIVNSESKMYLGAWVSDNSYDIVQVSDNSSNTVQVSDNEVFLSSLRIRFMNKNYRHASNFCNELTNQEIGNDEFKSACRHIFLYLQTENEKGIKFFLKILKYVLKMAETSEKDKYLNAFEYIINHNFILENYQPFNSSLIHVLCGRIVSMVIDRYPSIHHTLRAFVESVIQQLENPPSAVNLWEPIVPLLPILTNHDVERMIQTALRELSLPYPETVCQLVSELLKLLLKYSSESCKPSDELSGFLLTKTISLARTKGLSSQEKEIVGLMASALTISLNQNVTQTVNEDDLKSLLLLKPFQAELCCKLLHCQPSVLPSVAKKVAKLKADLPSQAPFLVNLLKMKIPRVEPVHAFLLKLKEGLVGWARDMDGDLNDDYQEILEYMIRHGLFDLSEVTELCDHLWEEMARTHPTFPPRFLSLFPLFDRLSRGNGAAVNGTNSHPDVRLIRGLFSGTITIYKKHANSTLIGRIGNLLLFLAKRIEGSCIRKEFSNDKLWRNFTKQVLKVGLTDEENGPLLLRVVDWFSQVIYAEWKQGGVLPPSTLYQMLRSHSQFLSIMLSHRNNEPLKEQVTSLQLHLVQCLPDICEERHVPVLLGAYGATSSISDQTIFMLLHLYEHHGHMGTYEPSLWGPLAVSHFAVEKGPGVESEYIVPKPYRILSQLDKDKVIKVALNFNTKLPVMPTQFCESNSHLYDQRFLLLLCLRITSKTQINVMDVMRKGVLSIAVAALSSFCNDVWDIGATILKNVYSLFETSRFRHRQMEWMCLITIISNGLEGKRQRIPPLIVCFIVRTSELFFTPENVMYKPVMNYLWLKPELPLFKVPELYVWFFSYSMDHHHDHRVFLLDLLASGIKDNLDFTVCQKSFLPKIIISLMTSPTVNKVSLKTLTFKVLKTMVSIPEAAENLVLHQGLLVELPTAVGLTTCLQTQNQVEGVIGVLTSYWTTWRGQHLNWVEGERGQVLENQGKKDQCLEVTENQGKRKAAQMSTDEYTRPNGASKRRRLINGRVVSGGESTVRTARERGIQGLVELVICLGRVVPRIVPQGSVPSLKLCFTLLKQVLDVTETLTNKKDIPETSPLNFSFMKQQMRSWIDVSTLSQRFGVSFIEGANSKFPHTEDWRFKPLQEIREKTDEEIEDDSAEYRKGYESFVIAASQLLKYIKDT